MTDSSITKAGSLEAGKHCRDFRDSVVTPKLTQQQLNLSYLNQQLL